MLTIYIISGFAVFILLVWLMSAIQIKVWIKGTEKYLNIKFNQINKKEDDSNKEK